MFGYGNFVTMIELHLSPAKSIPLAHFVENNMLSSLLMNSSTEAFPLFCSSLNLSCVMRLSSMNFLFSSSEGKSLNAETWTRVGGVALANCMSIVFRYRALVIVPFLKFEKEQFSSALVLFLLIFPGAFASASIILKSFSPKISFRTTSEWRVPDIITRTLFCSISSESFWARLIETRVTTTGCWLLVVGCWLKSRCWLYGFSSWIAM